MEYTASVVKIEEENNLEIKEEEEVNFELIDTDKNRYMLSECKTELEDTVVINDIKQEEDQNKDMELAHVQVDQEEERTITEHTSSTIKIKEENNIEMKQEEVNFEFIDTGEKFLSNTKTKIEESYMPSNIKQEVEEDQSNVMEFAYVQVDQEEEWSEPPVQETDPLATSFTKEINAEQKSKRKKDITDTAASTPQDLHCATALYSTQLGSVRTEQELCTNNDNSTSKYTNTENLCDKGIVCPSVVPQSLPIAIEKLVTNAEKAYKCTICDYASSHANYLKRHMLIHTGEKRYKCTVCDYSVIRVGYLKRHMRTHTEEKPFKCTLCGYSFSQTCNLKRHMTVHSDEKPYKCTKCDYSCSRIGHLKRHMGIHTEEKPYKCIECCSSFSQISYLKRHMRTHTEERPYKCTECDYSCNDSDDFNEHMELHNTEKPYKCTFCDHSCSKLCNLKIHMKLHIGEKYYLSIKT